MARFLGEALGDALSKNVKEQAGFDELIIKVIEKAGLNFIYI